jgi:hypothetical protein
VVKGSILTKENFSRGLMLRRKWKREIIMAGRQRANGEGSIRERYPGCWEGRYTAGYDILTGKRIQKGVFAKTRKECAAKLARAIQQDTGPYYRKGKGYDSQPLFYMDSALV